MVLEFDWEFAGFWLSFRGLGGVSLGFMLGECLVYWYFFGDDVTVDAVVGDSFLFVEGDGDILFFVVPLGVFLLGLDLDVLLLNLLGLLQVLVFVDEVNPKWVS